VSKRPSKRDGNFEDSTAISFDAHAHQTISPRKSTDEDLTAKDFGEAQSPERRNFGVLAPGEASARGRGVCLGSHALRPRLAPRGLSNHQLKPVS
jgi:hypothetical protein